MLSACLYDSWCLGDRGVWYALLMSANKLETAVQSSAFLFHLAPLYYVMQ